MKNKNKTQKTNKKETTKNKEMNNQIQNDRI